MSAQCLLFPLPNPCYPCAQRVYTPRTVRFGSGETPEAPTVQEAFIQTEQSKNSKGENLLRGVDEYEKNKIEGFWKQVGQRLKRFFQDIGNTFKRLFSHKVDFALDNSLELYKQKLELIR